MTDEAREVRIDDVPVRRRYEARLGDELAGFLAYRRSDGAIRLIHTEVDPEFEGHGIGGRLARHALDRARAAGERVEVECPFIRSWLRRHQEYDDLVARDRPPGP
jgi:predicted GNAT family acetyltransferase